MSRLLATGVYAIPICIVGTFIGFASGAIGICGGGGWGVVSAIIGFLAFLVAVVCIAAAIVRYTWRRLTA